ncbi:DUF6634 family protein [Dongia sedimenti]|uniref:Uncharacterized protein n=1 Tax=Dongia sedimenti TaxID=3064282 RepID=A0ABU0YU74_9PROT|nr:hypothetical protein [Rhodospirillaceae bacterium R-7]
MTMRICLLGGKGGSGRSTISLVLAQGFALLNRDVTLLECVSPGRQPGLLPDQSPPFRYVPVALDGQPSGAALVDAIRRTEATGDLVFDPPPLPAGETATLLGEFDLILVPVHPDPVDLSAARHFLEELDRIEPAWKAVPPRWVVHLDPIQSVRGSLSLVDALVRGWKSDTMPPLILPWTVPFLSRPDLRALGSAAPVTGSLAATCRILAIAATELVAAPQEILLPRALEERLPDELKARFWGEDRSLAEKLQGLAFDVAAIRGGEGPLPTDLMGVPVLDDWSLQPFQAQLLDGTARGHPRLGSGPVRTSMAVLVDEHEGWGRTLSRYYRLGRKAKRTRAPEPGAKDHG